MFAAWSSACVCVCVYMILGQSDRCETAALAVSWKFPSACLSVAAVNQPLTQCRCEDQGMLNISELLYIEVVTHLEYQE